MKQDEIVELYSGGSIVRYLSFMKFVDLLSTSSLYFRRADRFDDPLEGAYTADFIARASERLVTAGWHDSDTACHAVIEEESSWKRYMYINSWYTNGPTSSRMWEHYANLYTGVVIQSDPVAICRALGSEIARDLWATSVRYVNHETDTPIIQGALEPFALKDQNNFDYEEEYRFIYADVPIGHRVESNNYGKKLHVALQNMLTDIYVGPKASDDFLMLVKHLCLKANLIITVKRASSVIAI